MAGTTPVPRRMDLTATSRAGHTARFTIEWPREYGPATVRGSKKVVTVVTTNGLQFDVTMPSAFANKIRTVVARKRSSRVRTRPPPSRASSSPAPAGSADTSSSDTSSSDTDPADVDPTDADPADDVPASFGDALRKLRVLPVFREAAPVPDGEVEDVKTFHIEQRWTNPYDPTDVRFLKWSAAGVTDDGRPIFEFRWIESTHEAECVWSDNKRHFGEQPRSGAIEILRSNPTPLPPPRRLRSAENTAKQMETMAKAAARPPKGYAGRMELDDDRMCRASTCVFDGAPTRSMKAPVRRRGDPSDFDGETHTACARAAAWS